jgi:hypothetical protein
MKRTINNNKECTINNKNFDRGETNILGENNKTPYMK